MKSPTNNLYTTDRCERAGSEALFFVTLNAKHEIFRAHFPGNPIVPGVCLVQMAAELGALMLGAGALEVVELKNAKFLIPIDPRRVARLCFCIRMKGDGEQSPKGVRLQVEIKEEARLFAKLSMTCQERRRPGAEARAVAEDSH